MQLTITHSSKTSALRSPHDRSPAVCEAERRLTDSPYKQLKSVICEDHEGALVLRGTLPTYFLKQMAQAAVHKVPGVLEIHNRISVGDTHTSN